MLYNLLFLAVIGSSLPYIRILGKENVAHNSFVPMNGPAFTPKFYDDLNLDDVYGQDYESYMTMWTRMQMMKQMMGGNGNGQQNQNQPQSQGQGGMGQGGGMGQPTNPFSNMMKQYMMMNALDLDYPVYPSYFMPYGYGLRLSKARQLEEPLAPESTDATQTSQTEQTAQTAQTAQNNWPMWQAQAQMFNGGYSGPGRQPFVGAGAAQFFDDMNLDDVFGADYEGYMATWYAAHPPPAPATTEGPAAAGPQGQEPYPWEINGGAGPEAPDAEDVVPAPGGQLEENVVMVSLVERSKYCRSPILRLGTVSDTFECAQLVQNEETCSSIFYTGSDSNECTCAHIDAPCQYEESLKGNSIFQVVSKEMLES